MTSVQIPDKHAHAQYSPIATRYLTTVDRRAARSFESAKALATVGKSAWDNGERDRFRSADDRVERAENHGGQSRKCARSHLTFALRAPMIYATNCGIG